jgi:hypothetical protein
MRHTLIIVLTLAFSSLSAQMSSGEFEALVKATVKGMDTGSSGFAAVEIKNFKPIESVKESPVGTWHVIVSNWGPIDGTSVDIFKSDVIIKNEGDFYTVYSASQQVDPNIIDEVMERKFVVVGQKALIKAVKKAEVSFEIQDNRHIVKGTGSLADKQNVIQQDIIHMLNISRGLLHNIAWEVRNVNDKKKKKK